MKPLVIRDVRADMPNYASYASAAHSRVIEGIAIHHSASINPRTGLSLDSALTIFRYHTTGRGWDRGGYHYVIRPNGVVEYALDESLHAYHAGFHDPDDRLGLELGQYWNNRYLAICLLGWFDNDRVVTLPGGEQITAPNYFTRPPLNQRTALVELLRQLCERYDIDPDHIQGHGELPGCHTRCPGANMDMDEVRRTLCQTGAAS